MTRTDEAENKNINDCSAFLVWSTFMLVVQTHSLLCAPWIHSQSSLSSCKKVKPTKEGDIVRVTLLLVIL